MTRRRFLRWLVVGGVGSLAALYTLGTWFSLLPQIFQNPFRPRLPTNAPRGQLPVDELKNILALAEALIPKDDTPGAEEASVRQYVNTKTANEPGYFLEYQNAARLLDRMTQHFTGEARAFWELPANTRNMLLEQYFHMDSILAQAFFQLQFLTPWGRARLHCWEFVMRDLINDFYSSPAGWAVVGYTKSPGIPGDPRAYTRAPAAS